MKSPLAPSLSGATFACALSLTLSGATPTAAFLTASIGVGSPALHHAHELLRCAAMAAPRPLLSTAMHAANEDSAAPITVETTEQRAARTRETPLLVAEDRDLVRSLGMMNATALEDAVAAEVERMHPRLVVALQMAARDKEWKPKNADQKGNAEGDAEGGDDEGFEAQMVLSAPPSRPSLTLACAL